MTHRSASGFWSGGKKQKGMRTLSEDFKHSYFEVPENLHICRMNGRNFEISYSTVFSDRVEYGM